MVKPTDSKVPQIRFKGFEKAWEPYELGEVTTKIGSGKTPRGGKTGYLSSGIPLIRSQNIFSDSVNFERIAFISDVTDEEMNNSRVLKNDVLLNITGASIGRSAVYRFGEPANVNQHVCIIRASDNHHSDFIQLNLASARGQKAIDNSQAGGAREGLNFQQIGKLFFLFPSHTEQTKIGTYFRELDSLITLHQHKHDKLVALKKSMLQKMFPQPGATTPEIRFKGFEGEWVEKKLGDIGLFYRGISYNAANVCNSGLLVLRSSNIQSSRLVLDADLQFVDKECPEEIRLRKGDIALCMSNGSKALVGKSALCEINPVTPTTVGAFCSIYRSEIPIAQYLLQTVAYSNYLHELLAGSSINNLKNSDLCNLIFRIPAEKFEQQKIGTYFRNLDELITQHATQLQKLQQIKAACLERMFV